MKFDWSFPRQIVLSLFVLVLVAWYPLTTYGTPDLLRAAFAGGAIATANVLLGYAAIAYSAGKSATIFFKYVIGGMGIRIAFMAGLLLVLIRYFNFEPGSLVASLGVCYMVFLVLEIVYIQKKVSIRQQS
jgi:hypothetical protein